MEDWCDGHGWYSVVVDSLTSSDGAVFALDSGLRRNLISFQLAMGTAGFVTMFQWYGRTGMALDVDVLFHAENPVAHGPPQGTVNLRPQTDTM